MRMPSATRPNLPKGVARDAMNEIGLAIVLGEFAAGAVLPNEEALAARTGVSRPALREAIKVLSGKGLVRTARRYGSRVCPQAEWNFLDPDVLGWHLSQPENWPRFLRDTMEMRRLLEPKAAAMAARRASDAEIAALLAMAARLPVINTEAAVADDVAFHVALLRASHNAIVAGMAPSMDVLLRAYFAQTWTLRPEGPYNFSTTNLHLEMAEAIAARDPDRAARLMEDMLDVSVREVEQVVLLYEAGLSGAPRPGGGTTRRPATLLTDPTEGP